MPVEFARKLSAPVMDFTKRLSTSMPVDAVRRVSAPVAQSNVSDNIKEESMNEEKW